ncbi:hypothetical protein N7517_009295 [Penicillium concentricum]|uniref:PRISE-like Rossmann-fold domain-containing protein n=1 Tax=Penicillium concentricum TaxID=293559 RepID=A0A9W9RIW2_9EURO|nr:uncharacterized protein N7517_009295 [Penicillium concentricum]KAJ5360104.1 hypothetical protein N7517_009295 [Penicillium concentricum]
MTDGKKVALVFGASGISGWSVTRNLLSYPTASTFDRIIGLMHRSRTTAESGLPQDPRLELHSGVDLRTDLETVKMQMQERIPDLDQVTHVYYLAYSNDTAYTENVMGIKDINKQMTYNAVHAADKLCSRLQFLVLQTGTNNYGVAVFQHMDKIEINPPLREDNPRIPSPYGDEIFYYDQVDLIKEAAKGKSWKWCEVRPDQIIGFVPNVTGMNFVEPLALYLALYRFVNGPDARVTFPGTKANFTYTFTDSSQDMISKSEIYLSVVQPDQANGEAFNIADTDVPGPWSVKWPILAEYFGLKGTGPGERGWENLEEWWNEHQDNYRRMCKTYGLEHRIIPPSSWIFLKAGFTLLDRNREMCLDKIRAVGFKEEIPVGKGHIIALERIAEAKLIPSRRALSTSLFFQPESFKIMDNYSVIEKASL